MTAIVEACRVEAVRLGHWPHSEWHRGDRFLPTGHCMTCREPWPCPDAGPAPTSLMSRLATLLGDEDLALEALATIVRWARECTRCGETHKNDRLGWPVDMARHGAHEQRQPSFMAHALLREAVKEGYR